MAQRIRAIDIVGPLIAWLPAELAALGWTGVRVSDVLTKSPSVAVFRTGGVMRDIVTDAATVVIECRAAKVSDSMALALDIRSIMHRLEQDDSIDDVAVQRVEEFSGPAHLPSEDTPTRVTQTFSLDISAEVIG